MRLFYIEEMNTKRLGFLKKKNQLQKRFEYLLKQDVQNLSERKIISKIGLLVNYGCEYSSTLKSEDTKNKLINTCLILLSCGHQLGFELIDEFLKIIT
jgi:hypothetical protein